MAGNPGGLIARVAAGSLAESLGLRPGDRIVSINGHPLRDVLDYQFYAADGAWEMAVEHNGHRMVLHAEGTESLGIEFATPTFDGLRRCCNRCFFCFVDQLPHGLRQSLYIKDDDYRYSLLYGSFITLTNLTEEDWQRLSEQRLGPLYVSVHATDLALRRRMLGNPQAPDVLHQLERLASLGIRVHTQVVLCPGVNDGDALETTVADLAALYPGVQSVALVPVGLTRHRRQEGLHRVTIAEAQEVVRRARWWQRTFRRSPTATSLVYLSDELYLLAGARVPAARHYDGFPQYENGVGMVRSLLDQWACQRRRRPTPPVQGGRFTVACGQLIAPVLAPIVGELAAREGVGMELVPVENRFFGSTVTVSGLLTPADVATALRGHSLGQAVLLPRAMLNQEGTHFLDDTTPRELEERLGVPVRFANTVRELVRAIRAPEGA